MSIDTHMLQGQIVIVINVTRSAYFNAYQYALSL
jgi:hypothetical protein